MNVLIATQNSPLHLANFLDSFISLLNQQEKVKLWIYVNSPYKNNSLSQELKRRIGLYGYLSFLKMSIKILLNIILSYFYTFKFTDKCYSIKNVIEKYQLIKLELKSINSKEAEKFIDVNIDLIISIASLEIFNDNILDLPKYGCINYHTSLLPKYRGRQPLFWALYNNEVETGITIHKMDKNIDKGEIILQEIIKIDPSDSLEDLYKKTVSIGPLILYRGFQKLFDKDTIFSNIQDTNEKLFQFPNSNDGKYFRENGKKFI